MTRCSYLLPLVAAALLTACAGAARPAPSPDGEQPDLLARQQATTASAECEPGKEHWRDSGTPRRGGVLKRSGGYGVGVMQHLDMTFPGTNPVAQTQVYGYLVTPRACFYEDTAVEPDIAQSWETSPDGKTWTFHLKKDVYWHNLPPVNGRQFTSADVAWTIDYEQAGAGLKSYWAGITHEEPDPFTVVLHFKDADPDFLIKLSDQNNVMVPHEVKEQQGDFKKTAIGTRAYMMKEFRPGQFSSVVRNPDWKQMAPDGKPYPYIDEIQAIAFGDYSSEVAAVRTNQLDVNSTTGFRKLEADQLKQANPRLKGFDDVAATPWGLWMNVRQAPLNDPRVRKAVSMAINREEIVSSQGGGAVYSGFIPPAIKEYAWPQDKVQEKFRYDPEGARNLLAEAGYGPNNPLKFRMQSVDRYIQDAEVAQSNLKAAGIDVSLSNEGAISANTLLSASDWDTIWSGQSPSSVLVDRWLGIWQSTSVQNFEGFNDPQVDQLILAQRYELDHAKRKQIIDQLQDRLYDQAAYAPGISLVYYRFYSCQLKNIRPTHFSHNLEGIPQAWLDPTGC